MGKKKLKRDGGALERGRKARGGVTVTYNPLGLKIKKKCCRKDPRCINCPVVYQRLAKTGAWERNDMTLPQELRRARKW